MKIAAWIMGVLIGLVIAVASAWADEDVTLARMATCQESWLDWQTKNPAQLKQFGDRLHAEFSQHGDDAFVIPNANVSIAGLRVTQLFPEQRRHGRGPFRHRRRALR